MFARLMSRDRNDWAYTHALRAALTDHVGLPVEVKLPLPAQVQEAVVAAGTQENLGAMVARGLRLLGNKATPVESSSQLAADFSGAERQAMARSLLFGQHRKRLSKAFATAGIEHAFFKGVLLDLIFWNGTGLRGYSDLDLLIRPRDLELARDVLRSLGAEELLDWPGREASFYAGHARIFVLSGGHAPIHLDLHHAILDAPFKNDTDGVLSRAVDYKTPDGPIRGMSLEDIVAFSGAKLIHGGFSGRMRLALDAYAALAMGADIGAALELGRSWGAERSVRGILVLTEQRLGGVAVAPSSWPDTAVLNSLPRVALDAGLGISGAPRSFRGVSSRAFFGDTHAAGVLSLLRWMGLRSLDRIWSVPLATRFSKRLATKFASSDNIEKSWVNKEAAECRLHSPFQQGFVV